MDTRSIISKLLLEREEIDKAILLLESQAGGRRQGHPVPGEPDRRLDGPAARKATSIVHFKAPGKVAE